MSVKTTEGPRMPTESGRHMPVICAACNRVRMEDGSWKLDERFLTTEMRSRLSHGLCGPCFEEQKRLLEEFDFDL